MELSELINLAQSNMDGGSYISASALCEHGLETYPACVTLHRILGECLLEQRFTDKAIDQFQAALNVDPLSVLGRLGMGVAAEEKRDFEAAYACYLHAWEINPALEHVRDRLVRLRQALGVEPRLHLTRAALASVHLRAGQYDRAVTELQAQVAADPDSRRVRIALAEALWRKGDDAGAAAMCREGLEKAPENARYLAMLADIERRQGGAAAAELRQRYHDVDPMGEVAALMMEWRADRDVSQLFRDSAPLPERVAPPADLSMASAPGAARPAAAPVIAQPAVAAAAVAPAAARAPVMATAGAGASTPSTGAAGLDLGIQPFVWDESPAASAAPNADASANPLGTSRLWDDWSDPAPAVETLPVVNSAAPSPPTAPANAAPSPFITSDGRLDLTAGWDDLDQTLADATPHTGPLTSFTGLLRELNVEGIAPFDANEPAGDVSAWEPIFEPDGGTGMLEYPTAANAPAPAAAAPPTPIAAAPTPVAPTPVPTPIASAPVAEAPAPVAMPTPEPVAQVVPVVEPIAAAAAIEVVPAEVAPEPELVEPIWTEAPAAETIVQAPVVDVAAPMPAAPMTPNVQQAGPPELDALAPFSFEEVTAEQVEPDAIDGPVAFEEPAVERPRTGRLSTIVSEPSAAMASALAGMFRDEPDGSILDLGGSEPSVFDMLRATKLLSSPDPEPAPGPQPSSDEPVDERWFQADGSDDELASASADPSQSLIEALNALEWPASGEPAPASDTPSVPATAAVWTEADDVSWVEHDAEPEVQAVAESVAAVADSPRAADEPELSALLETAESRAEPSVAEVMGVDSASVETPAQAVPAMPAAAPVFHVEHSSAPPTPIRAPVVTMERDELIALRIRLIEEGDAAPAVARAIETRLAGGQPSPAVARVLGEAYLRLGRNSQAAAQFRWAMLFRARERALAAESWTR